MLKILPLVFGLLVVSHTTSYADALDNWTKVSTSPCANFNQVIYANGTFVATANPQTFGHGQNPYDYTNGLSISSDGTHWTHLLVHDASSGLAFGNGMFGRSSWLPNSSGDEGFVYAAMSAANLMSNSYPPYNPNVPGNGQYGLAYGNGVFVAVGYYYEIGMGTINSSTDGQNWTARSGSTSNVFLDGVAYGNGKFVAVGPYPYPGTNTHVLTSIDGTNWTLVPTFVTASLPAFAGVSFVNGKFYATPSDGSTNAYSSTSGSTWTKIALPYPSLYVSGTYSNGLYLSVHPGLPVATSLDGTNWLTRNTGITNTPTCIAYGNNCFVMCCTDGSIFRSGSTVPSIAAQSSFTNGGFKVSITDGIGPSYQIQASTNMLNWTNVALLTNIQGSNTFLDQVASNYSRRYYRAVAQ